MQLQLGLSSSVKLSRADVEPLSNPRRPSSTPLLKWPGGKRVLLKHLMQLLPPHPTSYYEPFLGGGALYFALQAPNSTLSDTNADLINCYRQVRDRPEEVIALLSTMKNTEENYYSVRAQTPTDEIEQAARLIYLTTLAFNGIHRLNLHGQFNVPYGRKTHVIPCDSEKLRAASAALSGAELRSEDFQTATKDATSDSLVYFDPPYTVAHGSNGFLEYNSRIFSWNDQVRLSQVAMELSERGCCVLISNADHPSIHTLYEGFRMIRVTRLSRIAASSQARRLITEIIFYNEV